MKKLVLTGTVLAFLFMGAFAINSVVAVSSDVSNYNITAVYDDPPKKATKKKPTKKCCSTKCSSKSAKSAKCDDKSTTSTKKTEDKKEDTDKK